jgi:hypothetical protein
MRRAGAKILGSERVAGKPRTHHQKINLRRLGHQTIRLTLGEAGGLVQWSSYLRVIEQATGITK